MIVKKLSLKHFKDAKSYMQDISESHRDKRTGIVDLTSLTEETAAHLDVYACSDFSIHDALFELAAELYAEDI